MRSSKYQFLCDHFPEHCDLIDQLASENSKFKEIVDDYADSQKALVGWQASDHPSAADRVSDYRTLLKELESEIKQFVHGAVKSVSS
jgi:uncharacterized protein YdcH (DUF465 family)